MTEPALPSRSPLQSPETWDAVAPAYRDTVRKHFYHFAEEIIRLAELKSTDHVLDIACGPGTVALRVAPTVSKVEAIDFSPGMIAELNQLAKTEKLSNVTGQVMDASQLNFADASFDVAFCMFGFMFFPDRAKSFREIRRVLRPGGRALIATWGPIAERPMMKLGFDALAEAAPDLPAPSKGDLQTEADCQREMTEAGFSDVKTKPFTASAHIESAAMYVDFMERGGAPFAALRKKFGEEKWTQVHKRFVTAVEKRIPKGGIELSALSILSMGRA
jgi:SAM-dependent methyltransferase